MAHWHDPAANGRSQTDGSQLMEQHRDLGLNLEPAAKLAAQARPRSGWESLVELLLRVGLSRSSGSLPDPLVPRRSIGRYWKKRRSTMKPTKTTTPLRDRCLSHCATLGIPLEGAWLDELLSWAETESLSHLHFLDLLLGAQADARRERTVARRIREARFADRKTLEGFNWQFNSKAFDRVQIEELASGDFIRRRNSLILVGWTGIGDRKSV